MNPEYPDEEHCELVKDIDFVAMAKDNGFEYEGKHMGGPFYECVPVTRSLLWDALPEWSDWQFVKFDIEDLLHSRGQAQANELCRLHRFLKDEVS